jgi:hypothetical protein
MTSIQDLHKSIIRIYNTFVNSRRKMDDHRKFVNLFFIFCHHYAVDIGIQFLESLVVARDEFPDIFKIFFHSWMVTLEIISLANFNSIHSLQHLETILFIS